VGSKKGFFGILGVLCLLSLGALGQFLSPRRSNNLADLADIYEAQSAAAQVTDEAHAAVTDESEPPHSLRADDSSRLQQLDEDEDEILNSRDNRRGDLPDRPPSEERNGVTDDSEEKIRDLTQANKDLESQQEVLIRQITTLKQQLREAGARAAETQPAEEQREVRSSSEATARLQEQLKAETARADKEHGNLKILADHILKLRGEIKDKDAEISAKDEEISRLNESLDAHRKSTADELNSEKQAGAEERDRLTSERDSLQAGLTEANAKIESLQKAITDLRETNQQTESERQTLEQALQNGKSSLSSQTEELEDTKRQLSKTIDDAKTCNEALEAKAKDTEALSEARQNIEKLTADLGAKEKDLADAQQQVQDREQLISNLAALKKELLAAKNQLLLKDKEIQLFGGKKAVKTPDADMQAARDRMLEQSGRQVGEDTIRGKSSPAPSSDVMVVEVIGNKVALRTGPSPDDSELTSVSKGNRLTVEERTGDWYRVIGPNSIRAYVRADMVRVISGGPSHSSESDAPIIRPNVRAPKKRPLKALQDDPNMVPFGDVSGNAAGDKEDRAFRQLRAIGSDTDKPPTPDILH
jgi:myosin heavy subunit